MAAEDLAEMLIFHREDYARTQGTSFEHFYCPMLLRDEPVELCRGHIVNQSIRDSSRKTVIQRKDIDGFYGTVFEADFVMMCNARDARLREIFTDPHLNKKLKPRIMADDEPCPYYFDRGHEPTPQHSPLLLEDDTGEAVRLVLKRDADAIVNAFDKKWNIVLEADFRVSAVVSLIKSAYLTLFRLLGYSYALSTSGLSIGHDILGRFFLENRGKPVAEAQAAARAFFQPFVNMVRPIDRVEGATPRGTVDDNAVRVCFGSSGRPFGLVVCVKANHDLNAILMPSFNHADSVATYLEFLRSDRESIRLNAGAYVPEKKQFDVHPQSVETRWPKGKDNITLGE